MSIWRLIIDDAPRPGAVNMAIDRALLDQVIAGASPALRFYGWEPTCLSLGRNQPAAKLLDREALRVRGLDLVRRPTGGLAVLHRAEVTYSVAVPVGVLGSPRETYRAINQALGVGLRALGVAADVEPEARAAGSAGRGSSEVGSDPRPRNSNYLSEASRDARCFGSAAPGELGALGRKLVGSAQRCERRTILQHGSILLEGDGDGDGDGQSLIDELFGGGAVRRDYGRPITIAEALGGVPSTRRLISALAGGFERSTGISLAPAGFGRDHTDPYPDLSARFRSPDWTWRR